MSVKNNIGLPIYHEFIKKFGEFIVLNADGKHIISQKFMPLYNNISAIQPSLIVDDNTIFALLRNSGKIAENNINNYIINAGGNVKVGKAYNKEYYVVGITNPDNTSNIFTKVNINNLSVVTSGNYQRYCDIDNIRYSHIINTITKKPSNYMKSVTVITKSSLLADIYSTYLYLLPVDKGLEVVNNNSDIEAIWYIDKDNIVRSDNFNYE